MLLQALDTVLERLQVALAFDVETALDVLEMLRNTLTVRGHFPRHPPLS